jgi:hypothetical protein
MKTEKRNKTTAVRGKSKYVSKGKRHMTVRDVIECYVKTGEPVPDNYSQRDPDEIISVLEEQ